MKAYAKFSAVALLFSAGLPSIGLTQEFNCGEIQPNVYVRATELNQQCTNESDYAFHALNWSFQRKHNCHLANSMKDVSANCIKSSTSMAISIDGKEWGNYAHGGTALADWAPVWKTSIHLHEPKKLVVSATAITPFLACRLSTSGVAIQWEGITPGAPQGVPVVANTLKQKDFVFNLSCSSRFGPHVIDPAIYDQWINRETIGLNISILNE